MCRSLERHRLLALANQRQCLFKAKDVLHFAPEPVVSSVIRPEAARYMTGDITPGRADRVLDIERIDEPDSSWDVIVCSHVLEHVNDKLALSQMHRVLRGGGWLVIMVPLVEGWGATYENSRVVDKDQREKHFGQGDHVRFYGRDIRSRIERAGFSIEHEETAFGEDVVRYSLSRGEKVFLCKKAAPAGFDA